jgi:anti-sigma regulatory factor (Ser/Thr protein kinase)
VDAWTKVADRLSAIGPVLAWADAAAKDAGLSAERRDALQVCLEEVLANLILHARPRARHKAIGVGVSTDSGAVTLRVADACQSFDPRIAPPVADSGLRSGGRGLRLLAAFASGLDYRSGDDGNELVMTFRDSCP